MTKDLHIATSLEDLERMAIKDVKKLRPDNKLYKSTEKVFESALIFSNTGDEEKAYILLYRFMILYEFLKKSDLHNTKKRLGNEYTTCYDLLQKLKTSLEKRYHQNKQKVQIANLVKEIQIPEKQKSSMDYPDGFMSCTALYQLISCGHEILILDVRSSEDYKNSCLKTSRCVNIPEEVITSGLSAYQLGKKLSTSAQTLFDKRQEVPVLVLMDWSSTKDMITGTKLATLKDILVNWDLIETAPNTPVIVDGGFLEMLQVYPMLCVNPGIVYTVQNTVLEDLLDLDTIEYPSTEENVAISLPRVPSQPTIDRKTKPVLTKSVITVSTDDNDETVVMHQNEIKESKDQDNFEVIEEDQFIENKINLDDNKIEENKPDIVPATAKVIEEELHAIRLKEAREKKKPGSSNNNLLFHNNNTSIIKKRTYPKINRHLKPNNRRNLVTEPGVTGLKNFGTTCYMSAVVQCLSNTQAIIFYFCETDFTSDINTTDGKGGELARAFGDTLQMLWSGYHKSFLPKSLKTVINRYTDKYSNREHQDAHEFLIIFVNYLHDELLIDSTLPKNQRVYTPKDKTWLQQTNGKSSIFIETFCGQIRSVVTCEDCGKKCETFDLFQNLTLHLPPGKSTTLDKCMKLYFSKQLLQGYECPKCKSRQHNYQTMYPSTIPHVLVIALKRFSHVNDGGTFRYVRNDMPVTFPIRNFNFFDHLYDLYAVINHLGTIEYGHYTAVCKNPITNKWHTFDDDRVSEIYPETDLSSVDSYVLFYQYSREKKPRNVEIRL